MADNEQSEGCDIAEIISDITEGNGLTFEITSTMFDYLLREKKVIFTDLLCALSYARQEWDI